MSCWADSRSAGQASVIQARTNTLLILGQSGLMWLMGSAERRSQLHPSIRSATACSRLSYPDRVNPGIPSGPDRARPGTPAQADRAQLGTRTPAQADRAQLGTRTPAQADRAQLGVASS